MTQDQTDWHRRFGLLIQDFFRGTPCEVELERDLSVKSQFLDVLIIHKIGGPLGRVLPDGLEGHLVEHNLISFKSHRDTMDGDALDELLSHSVNYRKQVSPSFDDRLPESMFRLFAIAARFPQGLHARKPLTEIREGVYEVEWGLTPIRIIVAGRLPETEPNALLHLFSASESLLEYGRQHCRIHSAETTSLLADLFGGYKAEGLTMPYTMDEFMKEAERRALQRASFDARLEGIPEEKRIEGISEAKRMEGIPPEKRLEGLSPEELEVIRRLLNDTPPA